MESVTYLLILCLTPPSNFTDGGISCQTHGHPVPSVHTPMSARMAMSSRPNAGSAETVTVATSLPAPPRGANRPPKKRSLCSSTAWDEPTTGSLRACSRSPGLRCVAGCASTPNRRPSRRYLWTSKRSSSMKCGTILDQEKAMLDLESVGP
jgi:hypothetical protein